MTDNPKPPGSRKLLLFGLTSIAVATVFAFWLARGKLGSHKPEFFPRDLGHAGPCPGRTEIRSMLDPFLPGRIESGQAMQITWNWYACHPPQRDEIAFVRLSRALPPKVRIIRAVPGDSLSLSPNANGVGWNLTVNGTIVSDFQGHPYYFGGEGTPPIGRYIEVQGKVLGPGNVIVLSTRSPGEEDSGQFGVTGIDDLVARVEPR